jgi:glutamate dehydrogenase/leucine dehydrogenase
MEAALEFLEAGGLEGKTVAVQGMGNVGGPLIAMLFEKGAARVVACDIDPELVEKVRSEHAGRDFEAHAVELGDTSILEAECDVLSPCATGAVLRPATVPRIRARVVCGAANNQLEDGDRDDRLLAEAGVTYVPDFLTNRMGIVHCANEQYGYVNEDPWIERHLGGDWEFSIRRMTLAVLEEARKAGEPTARVATRMADRLSLENHPLTGHRGRRIIASLVEDRWHEDERTR